MSVIINAVAVVAVAVVAVAVVVVAVVVVVVVVLLGVIVTMLDKSKQYDFISRYFAPWNGIDEDPVTGSAHTVISPMWTDKCNGQTEFTARQCSPR